MYDIKGTKNTQNTISVAYKSVMYKVQIHSLGMAWSVAQEVKAEHQVSSCVFVQQVVILIGCKLSAEVEL